MKTTLKMTKSDPNSIWPSDTHFPIAIVFACLYLIPLLIQFRLTILKHKTKYFIPVLIGAIFEFVGYISRAISIKFPDQIVCLSLPSLLSLPMCWQILTDKATIRSIKLPNRPRASLRRSWKLPPPLTSLPSRLTLNYRVGPPNSSPPSYQNIHHIRRLHILDPSIRLWHRKFRELARKYCEDRS